MKLQLMTLKLVSKSAVVAQWGITVFVQQEDPEFKSQIESLYLVCSSVLLELSFPLTDQWHSSDVICQKLIKIRFSK